VVLGAVAVAVLGCAGWFGWGAWGSLHGGSGGKDSARSADASSGMASGRVAPSGSPSAPASADGRPLAGRTVVIDPGHNPFNAEHPSRINRLVYDGVSRKPCDTTGTETDSGYTEARFTLDVAHRLRTLLQAEGARVVLTQDGRTPWGPCVDQRAAVGNKAHADAAISIHGDGGPSSGSGFHVIMPARVVSGGADDSAITKPSHTLGLDVRSAFHGATGERYADYIAGGDALDTRNDLGGLNLSRVPKVFIECGNMRNSGDADRMSSAGWRRDAAQGLANGLTSFLKRG
jgi:N-acetylmuramoyl-L-alanine amidase